ncbi:MAG: 2Fe-2S iron-sulfur cluster-binding protein, partial [Saprospiraceae bacterium]
MKTSYLIPDITPKVKYASINGQNYELKAGESILSFVKRHFGKETIPTLCDAPNLEAFGACRVCSVEVSRPGNGQ